MLSKPLLTFTSMLAATAALLAVPAFAQNQSPMPVAKSQMEIAAEKAAKAAQPARHAGLDIFEAAGGKVDFLGHRLGFDAWAIHDTKGGVQFAYTTPEGGMVAPGYLFDEKGQQVTFEVIQEFKNRQKGNDQSASVKTEDLAKTNAPKAEQMYAKVEAATYIPMGRADAPYMYVFVNPTCDHCHYFWNDLEPQINDGTLQVRLVPFGKSDANRAAAALMFSDKTAGADLWIKSAKGDKKAYETTKTIDKAYYDALDANNALAEEMKIPTVPFSVYRSPANGEIKVLPGRPKNTMLLLADFVK